MFDGCVERYSSVDQTVDLKENFSEGYYAFIPDLAANSDCDFRTPRTKKRVIRDHDGRTQKTVEEVAETCAKYIFDILKGEMDNDYLSRAIFVNLDMPENADELVSMRRKVDGETHPGHMYTLAGHDLLAKRRGTKPSAIIKGAEMLFSGFLQGYKDVLFDAFKGSVGDIRRKMTILLQQKIDQEYGTDVDNRKIVYAIGEKRGNGTAASLHSVDQDPQINSQRMVAKIQTNGEAEILEPEVARRLQQATAKSPYLVRYYKTIMTKDADGLNRCVDLLEDLGPNVTNLNDIWGDITKKDLWQIVHDVLIALKDLHSEGLVYGLDFSPRNIFLIPKEGGGYTVKLGDFNTVKLKGSEFTKFKVSHNKDKTSMLQMLFGGKNIKIGIDIACAPFARILDVLTSEGGGNKSFRPQEDIEALGRMLWYGATSSRPPQNPREAIILAKKGVAEGLDMNAVPSNTKDKNNMHALIKACMNGSNNTAQILATAIENMLPHLRSK